MNIPREEALTNEIFEVVQGWQTSTIGWQSSSDASVSEANYRKAREDHNNECKRRIAKVLQSRLAEGEQEPVAVVQRHPDGRRRVIFKDSVTDCDASWQETQKLYAVPQGVPQGVPTVDQEPANKSVPVEPTEVMLVLGLDAVKKNQFHYNGSVIKYSTPEKYLLKVAYKAMLSAAPQGAPK